MQKEEFDRNIWPKRKRKDTIRYQSWGETRHTEKSVTHHHILSRLVNLIVNQMVRAFCGHKCHQILKYWIM